MLKFLQGIIWDWGCRAFGQRNMDVTSIRGMRFFEESAEASRAAGVSREEAIKIVNMVYDQEKTGDLYFELGDVFNTWCALCSNRGFDADELVRFNIRRVMSRDLDELKRRNEEKEAMGLK